jgi:hypothetical protein
VSGSAPRVRGIIRNVGRTLQLLQLALILFFVYQIADAFFTPYQSEWLTADAFVPGLILAILIYGFCFLATQWVAVFAENWLAWLLLIPIAVVTLSPYIMLAMEATRTTWR